LYRCITEKPRYYPVGSVYEAEYFNYALFY
jgi:hypothetical protein